MKISLMVAMAENRAIGRNNELPWRLSGDLKLFKSVTMGHHMLMGRKTFESIGKPLPGRTSLVLSSKTLPAQESLYTFSDIGEAINFARKNGEDELFVTGGANVYEQLLPLVQKLYITKVHTEIDGDAFFPELDWTKWELLSSEKHPQDEKNQYAWSFEIWHRKFDDSVKIS